MNLDKYRAGSTEPWTVEVIGAIVRAKQPSVVIETGTFEGRTTVELVKAMNGNGQLFTVESDPERFNAVKSLPCTVVCGDALEFLKGFPDVADVIFLDDDHTADHVRAEIRAARRILAPGGIILIHDVVGPFGLGEVVRGAGGTVLDFPRLHVAGGLGVIT